MKNELDALREPKASGRDAERFGVSAPADEGAEHLLHLAVEEMLRMIGRGEIVVDADGVLHCPDRAAQYVLM